MDRERTVTPSLSLSLRESWRALWTSRVAVWVAGLLGLLWIGRVPNTGGFDPDGLTEPFGRFANILVAPLARWDSVWFLSISHDGYGPKSGDHAKTAFFPLYPGLIRVVGWVVRSQLLAGVLISLVCFLAALVLLHRLAAIELGLEGARGTILLLAFFPTALFFSAVYSESLFLLVTVGAVLAARQGRWAWAGIAGLLAALTRNSGVLLLVPLGLLYLYGPRADRPPAAVVAGAGAVPARDWRRLLPRYALRPDVLWLALVPLGLVLYLAYCGIVLGDVMAPFHAQKLWFRHFVPIGAATEGARAAWLGLRQLVHGSPTPVYFTQGGSDSFSTAAQSLLLFGFLVLVVLGVVGALRRLPFAYGAYAGIALLFSVSNPVDAQPLISLSRYVVVLFPVQMWMAGWCAKRGGVERAVGISAVLLGLCAAQFTRWAFVA